MYNPEKGRLIVNVYIFFYIAFFGQIWYFYKFMCFHVSTIIEIIRLFIQLW